MISVSVKGDKIVDHFGLMNSEFHSLWTGDSAMGSKDQNGILDHHSSIDEYEPYEDDYSEEEDENDELGGHINPNPPRFPETTTTRKVNSDEQRKPNNIPKEHDELPLPPTTSFPLQDENFLRFIKKLSNVTRDTGKEIKLGCEAEGFPPPKNIKWYKNGVHGQLRGDRFRIKNARKKSQEGKKSPVKVSSTLRIMNLEVLDKGFYTCEVINRNGQKIAATGILDILHDAGLDVGVLPDYPSAFETFPEIGESGNVHRIDSFHRSPMLNTGAALPNIGGEIPSQLQPPKDGHGFCQAYKGTVCRKFLENRTIYVHSDESQFRMESKLKEALALIQLSPQISERCSKFGIQSLCLYSFPICPSESPFTSPKFLAPRRLCREDCEILEHDICQQEYALAKHHQMSQLPMPQCSQLPPLGSPASTNCISLSVVQSSLLDDRQTCYKDKGQDYRGTTRQTASGQHCMNWNQQKKFKVSEYPELFGGHNFCRNPGGEEPFPWCFAADNRLVKESCRVDQCGLFGFDDKVWLTLSGGLAAFVLLILGMIICCCCSSRRNRKGKNKTKLPLGLGSSIGSSTRTGGSIQHLEMNNLLKKISSGGGGSQSSKIPEVPGSFVQFYEELGHGAFGKVYKGEAVVRSGEPPVRVVIKTLKSSATAKTRQDFFREVELMGELKHPNILCLLGAVTNDEPRSLLYENMSQGDLHEFLITHSPRSDPVHTEFILEPNEMLFIATQIAAGMEYLAAHHYVHRDLAARNALVGEGLTVKISDFGLSRDIYSSDYYRIHSKSLLPVRWMAPESILYAKFSTESDVWSFGVVLYEIYSYGLQPYFGYSNQEVADLIRSRQLLQCPDSCPPKIYSLMVECFAELSHRRPSFEELHTRLTQWLLPLLGPNSNFSPHIHLSPNAYAYPFAPPSCASNNSMSSHQSSNTGPLSNNTNSTSVSNQQWGQQRPHQPTHQTFLPNLNNGGGSHCVAYQSTPIVHSSFGSPHNNQGNVTAHFNPGTGRMSHSHSPHSSVHSPSPYRVLMESKATNI